MPRMFGFQAAGAAPIVTGKVVEQPETIATAIRIGNPASWTKALDARDDSGGLYRRRHRPGDPRGLPAARRSEAVFVEPASAAQRRRAARGARGRASSARPAGRLHGHRQRPEGPGVGDRRRRRRRSTIPVDAAAAAAAPRPGERAPASGGDVGCRPPARTSDRASTALGLALTCYDVVEFAVTDGGLDGRRHRRRRRRRAHATSRTSSCGPSGPPSPSSAGRRRACASPRQRHPARARAGLLGRRVVAGVARRPGLCPDVDGDRRRRRLRLATAMEGHPDNVAAACSAASTIAWTSRRAGPRRPDRRRRTGVRPVLFVPDRRCPPRSPAGCCPSAVPHADAAHNAARAGAARRTP